MSSEIGPELAAPRLADTLHTALRLVVHELGRNAAELELAVEHAQQLEQEGAALPAVRLELCVLLLQLLQRCEAPFVQLEEHKRTAPREVLWPRPPQRLPPAAKLAHNVIVQLHVPRSVGLLVVPKGARKSKYTRAGCGRILLGPSLCLGPSVRKRLPAFR